MPNTSVYGFIEVFHQGCFVARSPEFKLNASDRHLLLEQQVWRAWIGAKRPLSPSFDRAPGTVYQPEVRIVWR